MAGMFGGKKTRKEQLDEQMKKAGAFKPDDGEEAVSAPPVTRRNGNGNGNGNGMRKPKLGWPYD